MNQSSNPNRLPLNFGSREINRKVTAIIAKILPTIPITEIAFVLSRTGEPYVVIEMFFVAESQCQSADVLPVMSEVDLLNDSLTVQCVLIYNPITSFNSGFVQMHVWLVGRHVDVVMPSIMHFN